MLEEIRCEAVYLTHRPWDAPYLSAAALLRFLPESTDPQWRAEHLALPPCAECPPSPHPFIASPPSGRRGPRGTAGGCARRRRTTGGGLGGLDRLLRIRRRSAIQPARWENGSGHQNLRGGTGEPAPQAVSIPISPTSRPSPSSRQSELSKAVKNTPGISSIWNSNANF